MRMDLGGAWISMSRGLTFEAGDVRLVDHHPRVRECEALAGTLALLSGSEQHRGRRCGLTHAVGGDVGLDELTSCRRSPSECVGGRPTRRVDVEG